MSTAGPTTTTSALGDHQVDDLATHDGVAAPDEAMHRLLDTTGQRIAPVWPLDRFVAVNPYFGLADLDFRDAAHLLHRVGGARSTMSLTYYLDAFDEGRLAAPALATTLDADAGSEPCSVAEFIASCRALAQAEKEERAPLTPTVARVATSLTGTDWAGLATNRVSGWAASFFDEGQSTWRSVDPSVAAFASWLDEAGIDRTPEIMGLRGFRRAIRSLPSDHVEMATNAAATLGVGRHELPTYLHGLLMHVGGWAAHCARIGFEATLHDADDDTLGQFQAILLGWEVALFETLAPRGIAAAWAEARDAADWSHDGIDRRLDAELLLQAALDRSEQQRIMEKLDARRGDTERVDVRPAAQAAFCIDVRSEVLRRHLEAAVGGLETIGFAGFFGVPIDYVPIAHEKGSAQYPVLLTATHTVVETLPDPEVFEQAVLRRRLAHHVQRAWKSFKMGAISCFSFVGPVGLVYLPKLFADSSGRTRPTPRPEVESLTARDAGDRAPSLAVADDACTGIDVEARVALAEGMLRGTSLNDRIAPLVLIVGHGASTVNNPYENALHCGACGGNTGEANARVGAAILNDPAVRAALAGRGLAVPDDSWFVAGLHNTTTDEVTIFERERIPAHLTAPMDDLVARISVASRAARAERAERFALSPGTDVDRAVLRRSSDWAQVRPEWGLAGCRAFVAAPRHRTAGVDLSGQAFLHSYDWRQDDGFGILELILTAPVVVASWISLQYYASTVEPRLFGSGNKTLHNVVGRLGVLEGNAGDLRTGLPWQSVHDGHALQHEPLRLTVIVEAPLSALDGVLADHQHVADLFDHGWLQLLAMDDRGAISHRYMGERRWEPA